MNGGHVDMELSAYLDGEAQDSARIQRHLQTCPECARRHLEMLKMSARLRALRAFECAPDFGEKVLARIADTPQTRRAWAPALALAAAGLLLALGLFWTHYPHRFGAGAQTAATMETAKTRAVEELAARIDREIELGLLHDELDYADETGMNLTYEEAAGLLARTANAAEDEEDGDRADTFESIDALSREQMDRLADELETCLEKG